MSESTSVFPSHTRNPFVAGGLSLVIPGAGQIFVNRVWRGITILLTMPVLMYLIYWAWDNFAIGKVEFVGGFSWLWIPLALFWAWNVFDAYRSAQGQLTYTWLGLLLPALILLLSCL